jgi:hypothetical protein
VISLPYKIIANFLQNWMGYYYDVTLGYTCQL